MNLYGKVDVGAGILQDSAEGNSTCNGFHSGPALGICTRSADIRKCVAGHIALITFMTLL